MSLNLSAVEELVAIALLGLIVVWLVGVVKLFEKNQRVLGWVAIVGVIVPALILVGYAGWFVAQRND